MSFGKCTQKNVSRDTFICESGLRNCENSMFNATDFDNKMFMYFNNPLNDVAKKVSFCGYANWGPNFDNKEDLDQFTGNKNLIRFVTRTKIPNPIFSF